MKKERTYNGNLYLPLTPEAEVKRLKAVVEEKNKCIAAFKKYDAERKDYYSRFEANYKLMEEEFDKFIETVGTDTNKTVERQVACLLKNWRSTKYGKKYNIVEGKLKSASLKLDKLEKKMRNFLTSGTYILTWVNREEYQENVDEILADIEKIKEVLKVKDIK